MLQVLRWTFLPLLAVVLAVPAVTGDKEDVRIPNRPKVAGKLKLNLRERKDDKVTERAVEWDVMQTAIIICDMWDDHHCRSSAQRVGVMAPKMNEMLTQARALGVQIIHAPSDTMYMYADHPERKRILQAKPAKPPVPIARWCYLDPMKESPMPVDTSKCSCDDPIEISRGRKWSKQHAAIDILGYDGISDNGEEIYNFLEQEGITNVILTGVHTNMCVLGRSFGIRQMTRLGKNVALTRDLTDAMYDPRQPPYVSHTRGTELVIEHIEKHWCPSILSKDLTVVVAGTAGPARHCAQEASRSCLGNPPPVCTSGTPLLHATPVPVAFSELAPQLLLAGPSAARPSAGCTDRRQGGPSRGQSIRNSRLATGHHRPRRHRHRRRHHRDHVLAAGSVHSARHGDLPRLPPQSARPLAAAPRAAADALSAGGRRAGHAAAGRPGLAGVAAAHVPGAVAAQSHGEHHGQDQDRARTGRHWQAVRADDG